MSKRSHDSVGAFDRLLGFVLIEMDKHSGRMLECCDDVGKKMRDRVIKLIV